MYVSVLVALFGLLPGLTPASAESVPTSVTIKPSLGLNVSSSDITLNLDPATKPFDSKSITISVGTNNPTGYSLSLNSNSTELVNIVSSSETIPTLEESIPESSFPANRWGYRLGNDTTANYLPYSSGTIIGSKNTIASNDTYTLTIASKVDYMKDAGSYRLDLDLKALPIVTQYYMQDLTPSQCTEDPTIVIDKRDEQIYTIRRIGDAGCWMVDNLRFHESVLDSSTSNIAPTYTKENPLSINWTDLANEGSPGSMVDPRYHNSNGVTYGYWYNYAGASATSIATRYDTTEAEYSICPAGWHLPSLTEENAIADAIGSMPTVFNPVGGGWYLDGQPGDERNGRWWASTASDDGGRYFLRYVGNNNTLSIGSGTRRYGYFVRCLLQES